MCLYLTNRIKFISEKLNISLYFGLLNKGSSEDFSLITDFSFYCIFRKFPNFYGNWVFRSRDEMRKWYEMIGESKLKCHTTART